MKMRMLAGGLFLLTTTAMADPGFLKNLPAADFTAAGLQKLTPEELARLEALFQQYKTGALTEMQRQADAKASASQQEAEARIVAAETKAREAMAKADAAALQAKQAKEAEAKTAATPASQRRPGWFKALLTLKRAGEKPEKEEPLESRLIGDFDGWSGHTIFNLEDGTRWVQQNRTETYLYSPVLHSPTVKIMPAAISGFWLEIKGVNRNVRVIPLHLPDQK